ncbi:ribosome hibernation-promoting factor, HPF/YfiA family [Planomonospora corallina]|uniref:Ribosome hibernation promoting factor n=1 Tax=Planomonospora corallina TaxID=1806052 RepID=A0ABV8I568_9ACTN
MDIIVKGRHTGVSDRFRDHVTTKLAKIERLDQRVIRVDVEVSKERNPRLADQRERVELTIHSRGPAIRAEASAEDRFAALDIALGKLGGRLRRIADRRKVHYGNQSPMSVAEMTAAAIEASPPPIRLESEKEAEAGAEAAEEGTVPIEMEGEGPLVVREKVHKAEPMTIDQALLEMELVGHDFYLFRDKESGLPSVVYLRKGYDYGVLRLIEP